MARMSLLTSRTFPMLLLVGLLAACGSKLSTENFERIENGMSEVQVIAILGEPTGTASLQLGGLSGTSAVWEDGTTRISVQFFNGAVKLKQFTRSENDPIE